VLARRLGCVVAIASLGALAFAAQAAGTGHRKKPPPYKAYGHANSGGQVCFNASSSGNGGWETAYTSTTPDPPIGTAKQTYNDNSVYSWDETEVAAGACGAVNLLPGYPPSIAGAVFNSGQARIGWNVDDLEQAAGNPPVTTKCSSARTVRASDGAEVQFSGRRKRSSLVFTLTIAVPSSNQACNQSYATPGLAVPGGKVGDFLVADSAAVPITVFEHAKKVVVTVSSDGSHGSPPNCGVHATAPTVVMCTQRGSWQGQITFDRAH
jgi:hypothetical protein